MPAAVSLLFGLDTDPAAQETARIVSFPICAGARQQTLLCVALLGLVIAAYAPTRAAAADSQEKPVVPIWRPLIADPREAEFKMQWVTFREDWRFGTDVADSTTHGGYTRQEGVYWDVSFGNSFHLVASGADHDSTGRSTLSQVGMMAAVFADFAQAGAMLTNADYQVGPTLDLRFGGHDPHSVVPNGDACWSLRALLFHRSTHLGDEYISQGAFGRNQSSSDSSHLFRFPPVKRVNLSFQAFRVTIARETPLRRSGPNRSLLRIYGGLELKTRFKRIPKDFSSPIYQAGLELYGGEGEKDIEPRGFARMVNGALGWFNLPLITGEALMGVDMKVAKPFAFASVDNPSGYAEVWTP